MLQTLCARQSRSEPFFFRQQELPPVTMAGARNTACGHARKAVDTSADADAQGRTRCGSNKVDDFLSRDQRGRLGASSVRVTSPAYERWGALQPSSHLADVHTGSGAAQAEVVHARRQRCQRARHEQCRDIAPQLVNLLLVPREIDRTAIRRLLNEVHPEV